MTKALLGFGLFLMISLSFLACDDDERAPLVIPETYDGAFYTTNASTQISLLANLTALTNEAKKGRVNGIEVSATTLSDLFTAGTPSLKTASSTYYASRLEGTEGWLNELSKASGGTFTPADRGEQGGTFGGYLFSENGVEKEQLMEKGLFGGAFYHSAVNLIETSPRTPDLCDKLIALFGANPTFPNSNSTNVTAPDKFLAGYAARRDKNDGNGFYTKMTDAFVKLQAALVAGADYQQEQNEAIAVIEENWEKANAATMINYCHAVVSKLSATSPTDADIASSLHSLGECIGFIHGWRTISDNHKIITDSQIDEVLTLLNAPHNSTATVYKFATERESELTKVQQVISKLKGIYGFTDQDIEDFKKNWVAEQGR
jgi:hypothetical protein